MAKLIWIHKPYKKNNKWMIDTYFQCEGVTRRIVIDWATIYLLHIGKSYIDGNLDGVCKDDKERENKSIALNLSDVKFKLQRHKLKLILHDGEKVILDTKIFVGKLNGTEYRIPAIEIIKAIIGLNNFILNRMVEIDSLDLYFLYEIKNDKTIHIYFTKEYSRQLLNNKQVRKLVLLIGSTKSLKMFNQISKNIVLNNDIEFDLLIDKFIIEAIINKNDKINLTRIREITTFDRELLDIDNIEYSSPYMKKVKRTKAPRERVYHKIEIDKDKEIDAKVDGAEFTHREELETYSTIQKYNGKLTLKKIKNGETFTRRGIDEDTKIYEVENENIRTTADSGGLDRAQGLEYINLEEVEVMGELEEFIAILKSLKNMPGILSVDVMIDDLPEGLRGKKFAKLSDGKTNRRYAVGIIKLNDGRTCCLIEVEREEKSLSMLLVYSYRNVNWKKVIRSVILGLVNKSGNWDSLTLTKLMTLKIISNRIRHKSVTNKIREKSNYIYSKIFKGD
ncbi:MAG: Tn7-like element transposition protein TnsE [Anaeromicrobium sp.]|jgi:hypothetical protein|uniref:Tn7-like element transposition protein TnsE n=1 Tax=Anaeromicrobium sp. TaxID=1929132 RepID=UPI0025ED436C|nr:Tn7-like element transposition protein TnsE [Anaeromicrobium sp.]MCT4594621.1 Tn7-like element transposition protein TnsE [Anaeromicrobium sp.]